MEGTAVAVPMARMRRREATGPAISPCERKPAAEVTGRGGTAMTSEDSHLTFDHCSTHSRRAVLCALEARRGKDCAQTRRRNHIQEAQRYLMRPRACFFGLSCGMPWPRDCHHNTGGIEVIAQAHRVAEYSTDNLYQIRPAATLYTAPASPWPWDRHMIMNGYYQAR